MSTRIERDSMGELEVPSEALYSAQTQRAVINFPVSGLRMPVSFVRSLLLAKSAAAKANVTLDQIPLSVGKSICEAVNTLLKSDDLLVHFPVDVFQTGSGTSSNMNANEVLATISSELAGEAVSPNDHINCGQSSNDIIPSVIHISSSIELREKLIPALEHLVQVIRSKALEVQHYVKTGRTHLMDAMPVRLSQSLESWASQIEGQIEAIKRIEKPLHCLAQGGTAVGTGVNAHPSFAAEFNKELSKLTEIPFSSASNFFNYIGTQDVAVSLSGQLKSLAVSMIKIANDLRWMNSGPLAGLGEIELEAL